MDRVKYIQPMKNGFEIYLENDIIPVTGDAAKYLREVLDGAHVTVIAEINRNLSIQVQSK